MRQGDPMSPLLFDLVMEYLTRILQYQSKNRGLEYHLGCKSVCLNSLCFADDLILLSKANSQAFRSLLEGLSIFLKITSLSIKKAKSSLFTAGVNENGKQDLIQLAGINEGFFPVTYLVVPFKPNKWNKLDCACIIDKIQKLITSWGIRHLSFTGKAQLISSVIYGIRSYWMFIFRLPKSFCKEIDKLYRNFLWGDTVPG